MPSRRVLPLVGVLSLVAVGVVAGWFLVPQSEAPPPVTPTPRETEPEAVAAAPVTQFVERYDLAADVTAFLLRASFAPIDPDPRIAEKESQPLLERFGDLRTALRRSKYAITDGHELNPAPPRDWCRSPVALKTSFTVARERRRIDSYIKQLNTEEAKYQQRLARAAAEWTNSSVDLSGRVVAGTDAVAPANRRALRAATRSTNPEAAANAVAALEHLRQTQLEALFHRVVGKDHGSVSELVTQVMLVDGAAERLDAIDDRDRGAAEVHAEWRGELAARFAQSPKDVTQPEVAAWLLCGCYLEAKAGGPSGADFAFLDPARNPGLAKVAARHPFRRLVLEWAANHEKDADAARAAAELLKVVPK